MRDMCRVTVLAPAKINLHLGVYPGLNERGYHRVDSLMACVGLYDELTFTPLNKLSVVCTPAVDFSEQDNLVYKAVKALERVFHKTAQYAIEIKKNIPFKSGLGGASSDACAAIKALCTLWNIPEDDERIFLVAQSLGADTPFFLQGMPTLLDGVGDEPVEHFSALPKVPIVLVRPVGDGITAKQAYDNFDESPVLKESKDELVELLRAAQVYRQTKDDVLEFTKQLAQNISNNLDPVALRLMPKLSEVKGWMSFQPGLLHAMVTGSGSCIYGICKTSEDAQCIAQEAREFGYWAHATHIVSQGCRVTQN